MTNRNKTRNSKGKQRTRPSRRDEMMPVVPRIAMGAKTMFGFPPVLLTKLRYVDTYALISTAGSLAKQVMYLNSTFDPDNSGTGHQPLYRDTYAVVYDNYSVVSCRAIVTFVSLATTTSVSAGAVFDDNNTSSTSPTTLMEQNSGKHHLIPPLTGSISSHTISFDWDCKSYLGIDPFTSEMYKTDVGANPTELGSLIIWSVPADGSSTATVQVQVTLEQTVLWSELSTPTQS